MTDQIYHVAQIETADPMEDSSLVQLIKQGYALAAYQTQQIIAAIWQRVAASDLNRGLSISLPYFDEEDFQIKLRHFQVVPPGRIMFAPAFIVQAVCAEQAKVAEDTHLSASTRSHLLQELELLAEAFLSGSEHRQQVIVSGHK